MVAIGAATKSAAPGGGGWTPANVGGWLEKVTVALLVLIQPPGCWPVIVTVVRSSGTGATVMKLEFGCVPWLVVV